MATTTYTINTIADRYAQTQLQRPSNAVDAANRPYAERRHAYTFKGICSNAALVTGVALTVIGLLASKILLVVGLISLTARYLIQKNMNMTGKPLKLPFISRHYEDANDSIRTGVLRAFLGLPVNDDWKPEIALETMVVWNKPVPTNVPYEVPERNDLDALFLHGGALLDQHIYDSVLLPPVPDQEDGQFADVPVNVRMADA